MVGLSPRWRRLVKLLTWVWAVFLWYGPMAVFLACRFNWQLSQGSVLLAWVYWPGVISAIAALGTGFMLVFDMPRRAIVPFLLFSASATLIFSPLGDILTVKSFADHSKPEAAYVKKHCAPVDFVQDGKTYWFGACDLKLDATGQIADLTFYYDTSGDLKNYDSLSKADKQIFAAAVREHFNDDPNEPFEHAYFTAIHFYRNFYDIDFIDEDAGGFTSDFGPPPENSKNPYSPLFWSKHS